MAIGDVYELSVQVPVKGEHTFCVLHYRESVACNEAIPAKELAVAFRAAAETAWLDVLSDQAAIACLYVRRISPSAGVAWTEIVNEVGNEAGEPIPTTSAALLTQYSATASRRGRGRNYIAGIPENFQDGGLLEDAAIALLQALATELLGPITAATSGSWKLAVWSTIDLMARDVTSQVVRSNLGTMRTRRQRPGVA
jgi:hypothetical protein